MKVTYSRSYEIDEEYLKSILLYLNEPITKEDLESLAITETINLMNEDMELFLDDVENFATITVE